MGGGTSHDIPKDVRGMKSLNKSVNMSYHKFVCVL